MGCSRRPQIGTALFLFAAMLLLFAAAQASSEPQRNNSAVAEAGLDRSVTVGETVTLNGTGSYDTDGEKLNFLWNAASIPAGSGAQVSDPEFLKPSFIVDLPGIYAFDLIAIDDKTQSAPDQVLVSTHNTPPVSKPGPDQTAKPGETVLLDGTGSFDVDGNRISYHWSLRSAPTGSAAALSDPTSARTEVLLDQAGSYEFELVVSDQAASSVPESVKIDTINTLPTAHAGRDQTVELGETVRLLADHAGDADGDFLNVWWSIIRRPFGSTATLRHPTNTVPEQALDPQLTVDLPGIYVVQQIVNDRTEDSIPDTVAISTDNSAPVADAGIDRVALVNSTVDLDGSGSTDVDGDVLRYFWALITVPAGSAASLSDPSAVRSTFDLDLPGDYVAQLIVDDGKEQSVPDTVIVTTADARPISRAGPDQAVSPDSVVQLDGSASSDPDGNPVAYNWSLIQKPHNSKTNLSDPTSSTPTLPIDRAGTYVAQLIVSDGHTASAPDTVVLKTNDVKPVADAGPDQDAVLGDTIQLDGSLSHDADGDPLGYTWSLIGLPAGSTATLSDSTAAAPTFEADVRGLFVAQLIVSDGVFQSDPDTVAISVLNRPPIADAGADQTIFVGDTVQLDGSASTDPDGDPLTFVWQITSRPVNSNATLSSATAINPTFVADQAGTYVLSLNVNDGFEDSAPDMVTITAQVLVPNNLPPILDPVGDKSVRLGSTLAFTLTGSDPDNDPITFSADPLPLPSGATLNGITGEFSFRPKANQVGSISITFLVRDGSLSDTETISIGVTGAPPGGVTALSGRLVDTNDFINGVETPVVGAEVSLLGTGLSTISNNLGEFTLSNISVNPAILDIDTTNAIPAPNGAPYAGFRESVQLIAGVTNNIERPIFLPRIELASLTMVNPTATTIVTNALLGISMSIPAGSARNENGTVFTGQMSISEVPNSLAPAALPSGLQPSLLITVQPVGVRFVTPVPITFPNIDGLSPGSEVNIWSLIAETGEFGVVGTGRVSSDGSEVVTVSGGIRAADWHMILPPSLAATTIDELDDCKPCQAASGSRNWISSGNLHVEHKIATHISHSRRRALNLVYNSLRAEPEPVLIARTQVEIRAAVPEVVSASVEVGGVLQDLPVFTDTSGFNENIDEEFLQVLRIIASDLDTGVHMANVELTSHYGNSAVSQIVPARMTVDNGRTSKVGTGWSIGELQRLVLQPDESALLIDGMGTSLRFNRDRGDIVIVRNFSATEINRLQQYLLEMGLDSLVVDQGGLTFDTVRDAPLVIWDDLSFAASGITANDVSVYQAAFNAGIPLYFIGDDLAHASQCCIPEPAASQWESLIHLNRGGNFGVVNGRIDIVNPLHPAINGPFGIVQGFTNFTSDVDAATRTLTGELLLANTGSHDVIVAFQDPTSGVRTLTQNVLAFGFLSSTDQIEAKKLFKNAVTWLLEASPVQFDGAFRSPAGEFSTLIENSDGTFTRTLANGTKINFDSVGLETSSVDRNGNATTYVYDTQQRLISVSDPTGKQTTLNYVGNLLSTITDAAGRVTQLHHNSQGDLVEIIDSDLTSRKFDYDANHRMISQTSKRGEATDYEYNFTGRHVRSHLADGSTRSFFPRGITGLTDPSTGSGTSSNPATVVRPGEQQARVMDGLGRTTTLMTNQLGQATEIVDPAGLVTRIDRNTNGSPTRIQLPSGHEFVQSYNARGLPLTSEDGVLGSTWTFSYLTNFGQIQSLTDPNGNSLSMSYDSAGNPTLLSSELSRSTSVTYTTEGLPSTLTNAQGLVTTYGYDSNGNIVSVTVGQGVNQRVVTIEYDKNGEISRAIDPLGRAITFGRDPLGRMTSYTRADSATTKYDYDAAGNLIGITPPGRPAHLFSYNTQNQIAAYTPPPIGGTSGQTSYAYDAAQDLVQVTRADGRTVDFGFDNSGRINLIQIPRGDLTFGYDPSTGNLTSISTPEGITTSYGYDGSLLRNESWSGAISGAVNRSYLSNYRLGSIQVNSEPTVTFSYDADGLLTMAGALSLSRDATRGVITGATLDRLTDIWSVNLFGEIESHSVAHDGSAFYAVQFIHDKLGRVVTKTETINGVTNTFAFDYDVVGRLIEVKRNGVLVAEYDYDLNGNRIGGSDSSGTIAASYDDQDRLLQYNNVTFQYSEDGELRSKSVGSLSTTYVYGVLGNLITATLPTGTQIGYLVDGRGRRVGRTIDGNLDFGLVYQDGFNPVAQLDSNGNVISRFVYASRPHVPDYMIKNGIVYRIVSDTRGSPRLVVNANTGAIMQQIDYDEFGKVLQDTNPGFQPFGFAGGLYDPLSGLVRFGARDYDPMVGRWTAPEPFGFEGTDSNLYVYAGNDPVNRIDPSGQRDVSVKNIFISGGVQGLSFALTGNYFYGPVGLVCGGIFGTGVGLVTGSVKEMLGIDLGKIASRAKDGLVDFASDAWDFVRDGKDFVFELPSKAFEFPGKTKRKFARAFGLIIEVNQQSLAERDRLIRQCKRDVFCPIPPNPVVFELAP